MPTNATPSSRQGSWSIGFCDFANQCQVCTCCLQCGEACSALFQRGTRLGIHACLLSFAALQVRPHFHDATYSHTPHTSLFFFRSRKAVVVVEITYIAVVVVEMTSSMIHIYICIYYKYIYIYSSICTYIYIAHRLQSPEVTPRKIHCAVASGSYIYIYT